MSSVQSWSSSLPSLKDVSARDALKNNGTFTKMAMLTVTSTRDAFYIVAPLANVVDLVTFLVEVGARSPSQDVPSF